jgi:hypothetical protein
VNLVKTDIIPQNPIIARTTKRHELNYEAICVFTAIGFFLDQDTYWKDEIALSPGTTYNLDTNGLILKSETNFSWHHEPRNISFKTAVDEFTDLFESIIKEQSVGKTALLPLSGGLDSRSQAVALKHINADVHSYSYSFKNGFKEHLIGEKIAEACNFKYDSLEIPPNYLWNVIDDMANINECYSDFIHPRQMAVLDAFKKMRGEFSLGHWGDVLFDRGCSLADENCSDLDIVYKKLVKKGGLELASSLWELWNLDGDFESYFKDRVRSLLNTIDIEHKGSKIRAFKSLYWAPRWTSVSLSFFEAAHPIHLPYYHDDMCRFICELPEDYLADRKIQIEYIKNRNPDVANIEWQDYMPFNLYTYKKQHYLKKLSYRAKSKLQREFNAVFGKKYIQRNWELQFLGESNEKQLEAHIFNPDFNRFLGGPVVNDLYGKFKNKDAVFYSHAVNMLLTLSVWFTKQNATSLRDKNLK